MQTQNSPLVIFHKQLGDTLLLEPALAKLAAARGQTVTYATRPAFAPLVSLMENVRPLGPGLFRRASEVISFEYRSRACLLALSTFARSKRLIVGNPRHLHAWHRFFFPTDCSVESSDGRYRAEHFFRIMPVEETIAFRPPRLQPPPGTWMPAGLPRRYVLLHATSAWRRKCWSAEAWAQSLDVLHAQGIGPFVMTGGTAEWEVEYVSSIERATRAFILNLCGRTSLESYLSIVANAAMVLCIDGSSSHLAAAFGRPALTLFGPSSRREWSCPSPLSIALDARDFSTDEAPSATAIPAEVVIAAAERLWQSAPEDDRSPR